MRLNDLTVLSVNNNIVRFSLIGRKREIPQMELPLQFFNRMIEANFDDTVQIGKVGSGVIGNGLIDSFEIVPQTLANIIKVSFYCEVVRLRIKANMSILVKYDNTIRTFENGNGLAIEFVPQKLLYRIVGDENNVIDRKYKRGYDNAYNGNGLSYNPFKVCGLNDKVNDLAIVPLLLSKSVNDVMDYHYLLGYLGGCKVALQKVINCQLMDYGQSDMLLFCFDNLIYQVIIDDTNMAAVNFDYMFLLEIEAIVNEMARQRIGDGFVCKGGC